MRGIRIEKSKSLTSSPTQGQVEGKGEKAYPLTLEERKKRGGEGRLRPSKKEEGKKKKEDRAADVTMRSETEKTSFSRS